MSEEEWVFVRFHIRDGDRESFEDVIIPITTSERLTDEGLIKMYIDGDATLYSDDPQEAYYWI